MQIYELLFRDNKIILIIVKSIKSIEEFQFHEFEFSIYDTNLIVLSFQLRKQNLISILMRNGGSRRVGKLHEGTADDDYRVGA